MNFEKYVIEKEYTVKMAVEKMTNENVKAVIIVDNSVVLGIFTNGDMRQFYLSGGSLSNNISMAMNKQPKLYKSVTEVENERKQFSRVIYPIVDEERKLINVIDYENEKVDGIVSDILEKVPLVIMAGGKGTRLYPYTKILPKPLIPIGECTITERIIDSFRKFGCKKVIMILNYKSGMIKAYMSELKKDYIINYETEDQFLGTAGGLSLLKGKIRETFFLSNCDILINDDLECVYKTHKAKSNKITMICSMKNIVIPYGVVETDVNGRIVNMVEKPDLSYLVNTGVYLIEPEVLDEIDSNEFIHLPDLVARLIKKGERVGVFPISEKSWMDMGQFSEMQEMMSKLGTE